MGDSVATGDRGARVDAEAVRRAHLKHEASIKSVGTIYYLGAALSILAAVLAPGHADAREARLVLGIVFATLAVAYVVVGWGVRRLKPWSRIGASVIAVPGLLGFPIGTLISAYILYLMLSKKGRTVYSPEYREVIAATPQITYRSTVLIWIFLILILLTIIAIGLPAFLSNR